MGNPNFLRGRISNSQASCQKLGFPERKDFIRNKNFKIYDDRQSVRCVLYK